MLRGDHQHGEDGLDSSGKTARACLCVRVVGFVVSWWAVIPAFLAVMLLVAFCAV